MSRLEKILFGNVKVWLVLLMLIFGLLGAVGLSSLALYRAEGGRQLAGPASAALAIAEFPRTAVRILQGEVRFDDHEVDDRFPDEPAGFSVIGDIADSTDYVLVSRYDGNIGYSVVELMREGGSDVLHRWAFDDEAVLAFESDAPFILTPDQTQSNTMRTVHPWLSEDGSLFVKVHFGAMYRVGACSDVTWTNADFMYHHALEPAPDGNFWSVGSGRINAEVADLGFDNRFRDNRAILLSPEGEVLYSRSVMEILIEAGLLNRVNDYDSYQQDPIHLNDVQPVFEDGVISRRGDIYLSISHLNMLMLYRPETSELVWWTQDYMMQQHDIDILAPDVIQVFDNRKRTGGVEGSMTISANEMLRYELPGLAATPVFVNPMQEMGVRTRNQGLADQLASGIMLEDTNAGRLVKLSETGVPEWTYLNRSDDGRVWTLNWSRYIPAEIAEPALEQLRATQCNG